MERKKVFNPDTTRGLQSKINLKFPIKEMLNVEKKKEKISVKEDFLKEFDKIYS